jgi:hypothetical protein
MYFLLVPRLQLGNPVGKLQLPAIHPHAGMFGRKAVYPQPIESEIMMRQKLDYIRQSPVKRRYVDQPEHRRYSSARNDAGQGRLDRRDAG